jgi:Ser/Thr protein kinase RdoA (MazF antagonist)
MNNKQQSNKIRSILNEYGLRIHDLHTCRSLYKEAAAYRAATDGGSVMIKPFKGKPERLFRICSRIEWLNRQGFPHMPRLLTTIKGDRWVNSTGQLFYVMEWINGSELGDNERDYESLGEVLAKLHTISIAPSFRTSVHSIRKFDHFMQKNRIFVQQLPFLQRKKGVIGKWFREKGQSCQALAERGWSTIRQPRVQQMLLREKPALIHGDVTRPNVILNENGLYLIDWDYVREGSTYYEVSKTLANLTNFSIVNMRSFLRGYEKHRPLCREERLIISSFFRLPREAWIAASALRSGKKSSVFDILEKSWSDRMAAVSWMDEWASQGRARPARKKKVKRRNVRGRKTR